MCRVDWVVSNIVCGTWQGVKKLENCYEIPLKNEKNTPVINIEVVQKEVSRFACFDRAKNTKGREEWAILVWQLFNYVKCTLCVVKKSCLMKMQIANNLIDGADWAAKFLHILRTF